MKRLSRLGLVSAAILAVVMTRTAPSHATPRPLPFTYTADTLGKGEAEIENYVDLTPVKGTNVDTGHPVWYTAMQFQTEFEYGITDRLELGLYVAYQPQPNNLQNTATLFEGTGFKERVRYRLADAGRWPIDIALYGELVEYETEFEIEGKIILERRFGNLRIAANAWAEEEFIYQGGEDLELNPTVGATYEIRPQFHVGVEYWMRVEFPNPSVPRAFDLGPNQFVGPVVMFNFGKVWWSTGFYARVNDVDRAAQPGDNYGPVWVRTVVGIEL
jgi:hypothetical protein